MCQCDCHDAERGRYSVAHNRLLVRRGAAAIVLEKNKIGIDFQIFCLSDPDNSLVSQFQGACLLHWCLPKIINKYKETTANNHIVVSFCSLSFGTLTFFGKKIMFYSCFSQNEKREQRTTFSKFTSILCGSLDCKCPSEWLFVQLMGLYLKLVILDNLLLPEKRRRYLSESHERERESVCNSRLGDI